MALAGQVMEMLAFERMTHRIGMVAEPYHTGRGGAYIKAGQVLGAVGATGAALTGTPLVPSRLRRVMAAGAGAALVCASAATRFGIFHAGMESARDPKYTVVPQRERLARRESAKADAEAMAAAPASASPPAAHAVPPA
jgi:sulfite exporter TauE/SafE